MINQAYPSLNGIEPSWADISVTFAIDGAAVIEMADIAALKWSRKVTVGKKRGASGGRVMARTTGEGDQDCSATLYRRGKANLLSALTTAALVTGNVRGNQAIISLVSFDIVILHTPPNSFDIFETWIKGCRYLGDSDDMKEGSDPDKVEVTLDPLEIVNLINGVEAVLL